MSYSIAILEVSEKTYKEIEQRLLSKGYDHAIRGGIINMNGIGLRISADAKHHAKDSSTITNLPVMAEADDGTGLYLSSYAGGGAPRGQFSELHAVHRRKDGDYMLSYELVKIEPMEANNEQDAGDGPPDGAAV